MLFDESMTPSASGRRGQRCSVLTSLAFAGRTCDAILNR